MNEEQLFAIKGTGGWRESDEALLAETYGNLSWPLWRIRMYLSSPRTFRQVLKKARELKLISWWQYAILMIRHRLFLWEPDDWTAKTDSKMDERFVAIKAELDEEE